MPTQTQDDDTIVLESLSARERSALHDFLSRSSRSRDGTGTVEDHLLASLTFVLRNTKRMI